LGREHESMQENDVRNTLVNNGECRVCRTNDQNLCVHALTDRLHKTSGLRRISLNRKDASRLLHVIALSGSATNTPKFGKVISRCVPAESLIDGICNMFIRKTLLASSAARIERFRGFRDPRWNVVIDSETRRPQNNGASKRRP